MSLPRTILVPIDYSEDSERALSHALELAAASDGTLHLLHVLVTPVLKANELSPAYAKAFFDDAIVAATQSLEALADRVRGRAAVAAVRIEAGDPRDCIDRVAAEIDADLIVMGTHGRRGLARALLGSVAEYIVRTAPCPVLTVRAKQRREA